VDWLDFTFDTPADNLACDEALLDLAEETESPQLLRFWQPRHEFVVLGYGNSLETETNREFCASQNIPILRRCSGGGTVLQAPGCLNYSLILRIDHDPDFQGITGTNCHIMRRHAVALSGVAGIPIEVQGVSDLVIAGKKISGNAQRRKRSCLLFHGTFLLNANLSRISQTLRMPSRVPEYRAARSHLDFVRNLELPAELVKNVLRDCWGVTREIKNPPLDRIKSLVETRYGRPDWNEKF
jgi:lipoate-protein ligase A